jgi:hypothetical protein
VNLRPLIAAAIVAGATLPLLRSAETPAPADAPAAASDLSIVRIYTGWRDAASFKRIAEYFDGREHSGREVVRRSHPDTRAGYYFLVRLKNTGAPQSVRFHLEFIELGSAVSRTTIFPAEAGAGSTVFQLGLTGPEWQDAKAQPVAWHLQVLGEDGRVLATEKSYLWEKPSGK